MQVMYRVDKNLSNKNLLEHSFGSSSDPSEQSSSLSHINIIGIQSLLAQVNCLDEHRECSTEK